jgi:hypothetical protein
MIQESEPIDDNTVTESSQRLDSSSCGEDEEFMVKKGTLKKQIAKKTLPKKQGSSKKTQFVCAQCGENFKSA